MSRECYPIDEFARIAELPPGDARREHLDDCPRCQARLATYEEFIHNEFECSGEQLNAAMNSLDESLTREIFPPSDKERAPVVPFRSPVVRAVISVAAALLLLLAVDSLRDDSKEREVVLRTDNPVSSEEGIRLTTPTQTVSGEVELRWQPYPGADSYEVRILDAELIETACIAVTGGTRLVLAADTVKRSLTSTGILTWSVTALCEGDAISISRPATCRLGDGP
ncbi:MAG: hypothetical protein GY835_16850 [bacterium]|nr:hypothetical protein [bacterium]